MTTLREWNITQLQIRKSYEVTSTFVAFDDQADAGLPASIVIQAGETVFADPNYWRGFIRDSSEVIKFTWGGIGKIWFWADRTIFLKSTAEHMPI
jgi:hypothetical protein